MRPLASCPALLLILLLPGAAGAARLISLEDECNGRQLLIQGPIEPGDARRFAVRLAHHVAAADLPDVQDPDVLWTVQLDSTGGDMAEAMRIGRLLRRALVTTETGYRYARRPDGVYDFQHSAELVCLTGSDRLAGCHRDIIAAQCTGACLLIWLGGARRFANDGRLGLHGLAAQDGGALRDYLVAMGVAAPWVERLLDAAPDGDGWLSWPQRQALAGDARELSDLTADCPPALDRDESYRSITAADGAERDRLMDRADAHRSCRRSRVAEARSDVVAWLTRAAPRAGAVTAPADR